MRAFDRMTSATMKRALSMTPSNLFLTSLRGS